MLHLINGEHYSGAERVQDLLALRLPEFGFEAAFACLKPGRFAECRRSQETPLWDVSMRSRFDLGIARRIARLVRQGDYRLIHSHTPRAALVGRIAAGLAGVPTGLPPAQSDGRRFDASPAQSAERGDWNIGAWPMRPR